MGKRYNPNHIKIHRTYSVQEIALLLRVHKNTVRNWFKNGLATIDHRKPSLVKGQILKDYLKKKNTSRKHHCLPGYFYCFKCRCPRLPLYKSVVFSENSPGTKNLRGKCSVCQTTIKFIEPKKENMFNCDS